MTGLLLLRPDLEVVVLSHGKRKRSRMLELLLVGVHQVHVKLNLLRLEGRSVSEVHLLVTGELADEPEEGLLKVVVALGRDIVVLHMRLLPVELDLLGLHLAVLDIDLVPAEHDRDVLAYTDDITMPSRHVTVGDLAEHIKHDHGALSVDIVPVTKSSKLLLSRGVPDIEDHLSEVGKECERVHFYSHGGDVSPLVLSGEMSLHESGLSYQAISTYETRLRKTYQWRRLPRESS